MAYSALFGSLLLFPKDSFEIILPAILQAVVTVAFVELFDEKYFTVVSLTALTCCLLVILWHFNLNHGISRKLVIMLFLILPMITTGITYLLGKTKQEGALLVWKNLGISLLLTFTNFIIAVFIFYIFHYWIL